MKDGFKRFLIVLLLVLLSTGSAYLVDRTIDKIDRDNYPLGDDVNVQNAVANYSEQYSIPEEVIYTVMKMRSGCDRYYYSDEKIGLMALTVKECETVKSEVGITPTAELLRDPAYNLHFGVYLLKKYYSALGDWNGVYAALICGVDNAARWSADPSLLDTTGSLVRLPESEENASLFEEYLKTEKKYLELYDFKNKT